MRVLDALGWNTFNVDEVRPEYPVSDGKVDYALRLGGKNKVFLEAKRPQEDLSKHQKQLLNYSFNEGVSLAVLTNGMEWWLYLPLQPISWEERRFHQNDLQSGDISQTAHQLDSFLSRDNVNSGRAVENAESELEFLRTTKEIEETLPKAWRQLVTAPNEILVDLLDEKVEELSGGKAGPDRVKRFLASLAKLVPVSPKPDTPPITPQPPKPEPQSPSIDNYIGKQIVSFSFNGRTHTVNKWKNLLLTLSEQLYKLHGTEFDKALDIRGTKRSYFSLSAQGMTQPGRVGDSGYYAETKMDSNRTVEVCRRLLAKFGYNEQALKIEIIQGS